MEVFFQTYTVRVIRVFPMWMPGWLNGCLPGWCVQLQLYDKQTGEFRLNYALAVSAQTGEVIQNRHRED
ncbi:MAG TPA: hypothetical protein PKU80_02715 [Candidatus Limiplasma sp.]|nr:hypothetical protein [Candidatus Limiplasma sp.]